MAVQTPPVTTEESSAFVGASSSMELYYWAWKTILVMQYGARFDMDATLDDVMEIQDAMAAQNLTDAFEDEAKIQTEWEPLSGGGLWALVSQTLSAFDNE